MFGKFFKSTFTGSMMGAGANVFAVWGYVIAHTDSGTVEINPRLVAAVIGMPESDVSSAIKQLCAPDSRSRSKIADGRRLIREGEFTFSVPTHGIYRAIRSEEDRRAYNREKQREHRAKLKSVNTPVIDSQSLSSLSAYTEAEEETEPEGGDPTVEQGDLDPAGARMRRVANKKPESHSPITGYHLTQTWGRIRAEFTSGMPWVGVKDANGKASTMADELNENPSAKADVEPTMRLLLENAKSGRSGDKSALVLSNPSFGFGAWCSQFTELQEALRKPSSVAVVSGPTDRPEPPEWTRPNGPR